MTWFNGVVKRGVVTELSKSFKSVKIYLEDFPSDGHFHYYALLVLDSEVEW